ncbi:MAG: hypothetical protein AAGD32_16700 [Planctomycetota bacterium]
MKRASIEGVSVITCHWPDHSIRFTCAGALNRSLRYLRAVTSANQLGTNAANGSFKSRFPRLTVLFTFILALLSTPHEFFGQEASTPEATLQSLVATRQSSSWPTLSDDLRTNAINNAWTFLSSEPDASTVKLWLKVADAYRSDGTKEQLDALDGRLVATVTSSPERAATLSVWDLWRLLRVSQSSDGSFLTQSLWVQAWFENADATWVQSARPADLKLALKWAIDYLEAPTRLEVFRGYHKALAERAARDRAWAVDSKLGPTIALLRMAASTGASVDSEPAERSTSETSKVDPALWSRLGVWDFYQVRESARLLSLFPAVGRAWTTDWFLSTDAWRDRAGYREINALYDWLSEARDEPTGERAMQRLLDEVKNRVLLEPSWLLADDPESLGLTRVLVELNPTLSHEELEELANHVINRFIERPDLDADHWDYESVASLFASEALQAQLKTAIIDERGNPRVRLGKLVTWLKTGTDGLDLWRVELEERAEAATGDQRALWLLIRAEAASPWALPLSGQRDRSAGAWAQDALASTVSEPVRAEAVEWVARDHLLFGRSNAAAELLAAESQHARDPGLRERLESLRLQAQSNIRD